MNNKVVKKNIRKVLLLGSGALKIGEAGEFDYSGSQAIKALKEEGIEIILVNPNIATIQTSEGLADKVYFLPVSPDFVEKIIATEKPEGILLGFGGQTALNCGIALYKKGIFKKYRVEVLGTSVNTIIETEDRELFVKKLQKLGLNTPRSKTIKTVGEGITAAKSIGYPIVLRGGFSLGGAGSSVVYNKNQLIELLRKALSVSPQVLVEEYLGGWKEIEYEVVRDKYNNCITVCNMENMDPMGIHTGESIVVAPSQTLTNSEYFKLREIAIYCIKQLGVIGECNIQFALNLRTFEYRIIEVNARLSRSSALASKATGYPLAFVAAKLSLGYALFEVKNSVTGVTSAFFEPALDYIVVKIPRWDLTKFQAVREEIGTEMKSVGEVMSIGRTFEEAIQKAVRSLALGYEGIIPDNDELKRLSKKEAIKLLQVPRVGRLNLICVALIKGVTVAEIHKMTSIDQWFIKRIEQIVLVYKELIKKKLTNQLLKKAKLVGFSDRQIGGYAGRSWEAIRSRRKKLGIVPVVNQIDTLAGEFPAQTNYLYLTYHGFFKEGTSKNNKKKNIAVLGSGPYHIGSSVEFDWCAVSTVNKLKTLGYSTIVVNCNPETVSTDYDISDKLYFEELTLERLLDIYDIEKFSGCVVSVGGQTPNNLAESLKNKKVPILGTDPVNIDKAEDRNKFSALLDKLKIPQPFWKSVTNNSKAYDFSRTVGFPILLRPSYVLSGTAMKVVYTKQDLINTLNTIKVNRDYPLVVSQFIEGAAEVEVDAVSVNGEVVAFAILKHIEEAGVHSGDATVMFTKDLVNEAIAKRIEEITRLISKNLQINGPFNIQFLVKHAVILVIECNLRASRSFPFTSKVAGVNLIDLATEAIANKKVQNIGRLIPEKVGVKAAQFSFGRLRGADPILQIEMASTGEVGCFGNDLEEAFLKAMLSVGLVLPKKRILVTVGNAFKGQFVDEAKTLYELGFKLYATEGTAMYLKTFGVAATIVRKGYQGGKNNVIELIKSRKVDFVINIRDREESNGEFSRVVKERSDGYQIRRAAADHNIPLITNLKVAKLLILSLANKKQLTLEVFPWEYYLHKGVQERLI